MGNYKTRNTGLGLVDSPGPPVWPLAISSSYAYSFSLYGSRNW